MDESSSTVIESVRSLMPISTLYLLGRPLTDAEAHLITERQAVELLRLLRITKPSVEIELIAELPEIEISVIPDFPLSGSSEWTGDAWHVKINASDSLWRCRSTLAHELKHILDDPFREELYPGWPHGSTDTPPEQAEAICEYFAGCVLVPQPWLNSVWDKGIRDPADLASLFDVSQRLIEVRMDQTNVTSRPRTTKRLRRASRRMYERRLPTAITAPRQTIQPSPLAPCGNGQ